VSVSVNLIDLKGGMRGAHFILADLYAPPFDLELFNYQIRHDNIWGGTCFLEVTHAPSQGGGVWFDREQSDSVR